MSDAHKIAISVETEYLPEESDIPNHKHVFVYTITIVNEGTVGARLIGRHWVITDGDLNTQEIRAEGVVGEQPKLHPGENFKYTSYAIINTPIGSMMGSYQMINDAGQLFDAEIPTFLLANPMLIH
ncbi:MAG: Co2+/Mg2+ efflux protein ApaG [Gammaproteobacteria bacterium]|nr:Co2+/Mg2+ efflux protein ApaG [Gammaproteobacteria bacterium]